ncbi:hypothetical protein ZWY2020_027338 [Hordeum vulgare]|nr:hypothetical protein ZWY2020_027338 [Hordeum vulgare]
MQAAGRSMESTAVVLARASSVARDAAEAELLSSLHLVWVAGLVVHAVERCGLMDRARELQETVDALGSADLQTMANAAAMMSSAAARAALEAEMQEGELAGTCRNLELAARELSLAVAAGSKAIDEGTCQSVCWIKKDRRDDELDESGLRQALLQNKAWPLAKKASTVLAGAPGSEENLDEFLGYALFGSLTLLPYLDPAGPVMKTLSKSGKLIFHVAFSVVWGTLGLGVACRQCRDAALMLRFADVASHIGMAGITALVIWFANGSDGEPSVQS